MQTFMPFPDFDASARILDTSRLGKQRVEVLQILRALAGKTKGWRNHPATKMWRGHERCLVRYGIAVCSEWIDRGHRDTCLAKIVELGREFPEESRMYPDWIDDEEFHLSHQSKLYAKDPVHYALFAYVNAREYLWPEPKEAA